MQINLILYAIPVFFLLIFIELLFCLIKKKNFYRLNDSITDLSTGIGNQLAGIVFRSFYIFPYIYLYHNYRIYTFDFSTPFKSFLAWILALIIYDFFYYWFHRMSHEWNLFWASHVVHHSSEEYNLTVALRQPAFGIFSWIFYLPMAIIGFSPEFYIIHGQISLIYQFWIHTRLVGKLGILESILNTPSHHRVHHGKNPKYIDKNYGGILIIWDKIFGTFQKEEEEPAYGITKPLKSWNPFWANIHHYWDLIHFSFKVPNWKDKIKVWFSYPGWKPSYLTWYQYPSEKNQPYRNLYEKFDTKIPKHFSFYALFWFTLTTIYTLVFLIQYQSLNAIVFLLSMIMIIISLVSIGGILQKTSWAFYLEISRLTIISLLIIFYYDQNNFIINSLHIVNLLSLLFILKYKKEFDSITETIVLDEGYNKNQMSMEIQ